MACEWCKSLSKKVEDFKPGDMLARGVVEHTFWGDGRWYQQNPRFCPMCGKDMRVGKAEKLESHSKEDGE